MHLTIAAKDVQPGDYLHDSGHYNKRDPWVRVKSVREVPATWSLEGGGQVPGTGIEIQTVNWSTVRHPRERVGVRR